MAETPELLSPGSDQVFAFPINCAAAGQDFPPFVRNSQSPVFRSPPFKSAPRRALCAKWGFSRSETLSQTSWWPREQRNRSRRRASVTYTLAHPQSPPNTHTHTHTSRKVHEKAYRELNFMYTFMAMCTRLLWGPCYAYRNDEFLAEQNASWSPMGHSPILIRWH